MPAAAVIPAPLAYIKVAAVKKLVVGSRDRVGGFVASPCVSACGVVASRRPCRRGPHLWWGSTSLVQPAVASRRVSLIGCPFFGRGHFTLNKSECSKQALRRSNVSAWNNGRGPASASVGLTEAGNDQEGRTGAEVWPGER